MAVLAACMLIADLYLAPVYPFLLLVILLLAFGACSELHRLLAAVPNRPPFWLCAGGVFVVLLANWPVHILDYHLGGPGLAKLQFGLGSVAIRDVHVRGRGDDGVRRRDAALSRFRRVRAAHRADAMVRRLFRSVTELFHPTALAAAAVRRV